MAIHELKIEGMGCGHCVKSVEAALAKVPGITKSEVEVGRARVEGEVTREALVAAIEAAEYQVVEG